MIADHISMARVLLVEDDPASRRLFVEQLQGGGHQVLGADSAESAMALLGLLGLPDVAVIDVQLPGMDGFDLLHLLRRRQGAAHLGAVLMTAGPTPALIGDNDAFLAKPLSSLHLLTAVATVSPAAAARPAPTVLRAPSGVCPAGERSA